MIQLNAAGACTAEKVITPLTLGVQGRLASLVLRDLVHGVLAALLALAERPLVLRDVDLQWTAGSKVGQSAGGESEGSSAAASSDALLLLSHCSCVYWARLLLNSVAAISDQ